MGTAEFKVEDPRSLLPVWFHPVPIQLDHMSDEEVCEIEEDCISLDAGHMDSVDGGQGQTFEEKTFDSARVFMFGISRNDLMPNALTLPATLHILNNILEEVSTHLKYWQPFFEKLQYLERLMKEGRKERFVRYCILQSVVHDQAQAFRETNFGNLYLERFGAVHYFCSRVKPWLPVIRVAWDERKYVAGNGSDALTGSGAEFKPATMTAILQDNSFFAYLSMVLIWQSMLEGLAGWTESCPCHGNMLGAAGSEAARQKILDQAYERKHSSCPMKGKRFPELVAGELQSVFQTLAQASLQSLVLECQVWVVPERWCEIMADFEKAKNHMEAALSVKFDWLQRLPWRLGALAHWDPCVARRHGRQIVQEFDQQPDDVQRLHHPRTLLFLSSSSPVRPMLNRFLDGEPFAAVPELELHVAVFRFCNVVERFIEASHSLVSRSHVTNASGPVVSLTRRLWQLQQELRHTPAKLAVLAVHFEAARHAADLPWLLGLGNHPIFQSCSSHQMPSASVIKYMGKIMYGLDLDNRFPNVGPAAKFHQRETAAQRRGEKRKVEKAYAKEERVSECLVFRRAFIDHFRQCVSEFGNDHEVYFSCQPSTHAGCSGVPLQAAMDVGPSPQDSSTITNDCLELDDGQLDALRPDGLRCFQIVKAMPSNWHTVPMSAAAGARLGVTDIIVSERVCNQLDGPNGSTVSFSMPFHHQGRECETVVMRDFFGLSMDELEGSLTQWELERRGPQVHLPGFEASLLDEEHVQDVLQLLVFGNNDRRAQPENISNADLPIAFVRPHEVKAGVFETLVAQGFAQQVCDGGHEWGFQLLPHSFACITLRFQLCNPVLVSQIQRVSLPLEERSTYELLCLLRSNGWQWQKPTSKERKSLEFRANDGSSPKFYFCGVQGERSYFACLLDADRLAGLGVDAIRHQAPAGYYNALLAGNLQDALAFLERRQAQNAIEDFVMDCPDHVLAPVVPDAIMDDMHAMHDADPEIEIENSNYNDGRDGGHDEGRGSISDEVDISAPAAGENKEEEVEVANAQPAVENAASSSSRPPQPGDGDSPAARPEKPKVLTPGVESFKWGEFRFIPKHGPQGLQWEATCPYHRKNSKTGCKKLMSTSKWGSSDNVIHLLKHWCVQASAFQRQSQHLTQVDFANPQPLAALDLARQAMRSPPAVPRADDEQDAANPNPKAVGKPAAKPKPKPQPRAKAEPAAPPAAAAAAGRRSSSDSNDSDSDSSSSSSTSGSGSADSSSS